MGDLAVGAGVGGPANALASAGENMTQIPPEVQRPGFMGKMGAGIKEGLGDAWEARKSKYGIGTGEEGRTTLGSLAGATMQRQMSRLNPIAAGIGEGVASTFGVPMQPNSGADVPVGKSQVSPMPQRGPMASMQGGGGFYAGHFQFGGGFTAQQEGRYVLDLEEGEEVEMTPRGVSHASTGLPQSPSMNSDSRDIAAAVARGDGSYSALAAPQGVTHENVADTIYGSPSGAPVGAGAMPLFSEEEITFDEKPSLIRSGLAGLFGGNPVTSWARQKGEISGRNRGDLLRLAYEKTKGRRLTPDEREDLELALGEADPAGYRPSLPGVSTPPTEYSTRDGIAMMRNSVLNQQTGQYEPGEWTCRWQSAQAPYGEGKRLRNSQSIRDKWNNRTSEADKIELFKEAWPGGAPVLDPNDDFSIQSAMLQSALGSPYANSSSRDWINSVIESMSDASADDQRKF